jgi:phage terminase large subunit-like protein
MKHNAGSDRAVAVINRLTHTGDFNGQPFALRPWQERDIIRPLFKTRPDGLRQYRTCLLMLPRKNGKTELAAAIAIYGLLFDRSSGGEIYLAAADRDQAGKVFGAMVAMIRNDSELEVQVEIIESQKRIVHRKSGSFCKAISAEAYNKHGYNASVVIYDELHCAPNRLLYDVLATSFGGRLQPLMVSISTAGFDRHSILWEIYTHAKKVRENPSIDPTFLPIIYEAPIGSDWTSEKVWKACNPALGDFRSLEDMRIACARAKEIPAQENTFKRLFLNMWTEQASRWIQMSAWNACRSTVDRSSLKGRRCYVGMDLSSTKDLTALVAVFPDEDGFDVLAQFFVPQETLRERSDIDRRPYKDWVRMGPHILTATPGNVVDYEAVRQTLKDWAAEFDVREIAFDPWNATDLVTRLQEQDGFTCVAMRQGFTSLSAPSKALEKAVLGRTLRHDGHPVLADHMANVSVESDATGNIKPSKKVSTERIDGVVALIMAIDMMERHSHDKGPEYPIFILGGGR